MSFSTPLALAQGEIYKCPDASGRQTYTNIQRDTVGKNFSVVSREVSVVPALPAARPTQAKASGGMQSASLGRAESRRKILESELENEEKLLGSAKAKLAEQESVRHGDERNYAKVQERLKSYQETVELHQKNVDQLRREISSAR
ncbi:MAG: DUF4124 domain-containing protein [Betaproteobacteria bacterium]|nr:DUF4124 domain-containing protein [Betaproteobacteria bacterium]